MRISSLLARGLSSAAYGTVAVLASCGLSQVVGVALGAINMIRWGVNERKLSILKSQGGEIDQKVNALVAKSRQYEARVAGCGLMLIPLFGVPAAGEYWRRQKFPDDVESRVNKGCAHFGFRGEIESVLSQMPTFRLRGPIRQFFFPVNRVFANFVRRGNASAQSNPERMVELLEKTLEDPLSQDLKGALEELKEVSNLLKLREENLEGWPAPLENRPNQDNPNITTLHEKLAQNPRNAETILRKQAKESFSFLVKAYGKEKDPENPKQAEMALRVKLHRRVKLGDRIGEISDVKIPVKMTKPKDPTVERYLDGYCSISADKSEDKSKPWVVVFHGTGGTATGASDRFLFYKEMGYNVLAVTMGGYPGSDPVKGGTSEVSTIQDANAAIQWILEQNPEAEIIAHGTSMGGHLAFNAATLYPDHVKAVVADQTYTRAADAAANATPGEIGLKMGFRLPFPKAVVRGIVESVFPSGRPVPGVHQRSPDGSLSTAAYTTNGMNNVLRAASLTKSQEVIVIAAGADSLMGYGKVNRERENGHQLNQNTAEDLLKAHETQHFIIKHPGKHVRDDPWLSMKPPDETATLSQVAEALWQTLDGQKPPPDFEME